MAIVGVHDALDTLRDRPMQSPPKRKPNVSLRLGTLLELDRSGGGDAVYSLATLLGHPESVLAEELGPCPRCRRIRPWTPYQVSERF